LGVYEKYLRQVGRTSGLQQLFSRGKIDMMRFRIGVLTAGALLLGAGCVSAYTRSVGGESAQVFERIYFTDFNTAWQSVLDALKNSRLDISNREGGFIQTKWNDNTSEKNFADPFGSANAYLKAQFRFHISVAKGFYNGQATIKVSVLKEQL